MEDCESDFKWGLKRTVDGEENNGIQYYESFTWNGQSVSLYDCVVFYSPGAIETYVGKILKLYELPNRQRKVEVVWLFRPLEIRIHLGEGEIKWNELFLASGQGMGVTGVNNVENIICKCNVACVSKDKRNPEASEIKLRKADYIFYRTFDINKQVITKKFPDEIAGVKVEFLFNRVKSQTTTYQGLKKQTEQLNISLRTELNKSNMPTIRKSSNDQTLTPPRLEKQTEQCRLPLRIKLNKSAVGTGEKIIPTSPSQKQRQPMVLNDRTRPESQNQVEQFNRRPKIGFNNGAVGPPKNNIPSNGTTSMLKNRKVTDPDSLKQYEKFNMSTRTEPKRDRVSPLRNGVPSSTSVAIKESEKCKSFVGEHRNSSLSPLSKRLPETQPGREVKDMTKVRRLEGGFSENNSLPLKKRTKLLDEKGSSFQGQSKASFGVVKAIRKAENTGARVVSDRGTRPNEKFTEVTERPDADRRSWFKQRPWEERLPEAQELGTLVLLENLDPSFTSYEVEDIVWHALKEKVDARMIESSTFSSPLYGKAFVIFKTNEAAIAAFKQLTSRYLILGDGRPVFARRRNFVVPSTETNFPGHLVLEKNKHQRKSFEMRNAVSTAHCSQPNNLEYDFALQWLELQEKSDLQWMALYKEQLKEINAVKSNLKLNRYG